MREIIFVRGTTEAINLVAQAWARPRLGPGDEILITALEHHANIVPWQMVCEQTGCTLRVAPINRRGELELDAVPRAAQPAHAPGRGRARLERARHRAAGAATMIDAAHAHGALVLVDGAQAVPHSPVDVRALGADFYAFSGHKLYGPTGIGVLYGREELLAAMPPWQGGGDMILTVSFEKTTYNELPWKFEAGTPNISGAVGLAAAMDYIESLGLEAIAAHEQRLLQLATAELARLPDIEIIGTAAHKAAVLSFTMKGVHPHDLGTILDAEGVAVRTGHHCAMPVMTFFGCRPRRAPRSAATTPSEDVAQPGRGAARGRARCSADGSEGALPRRDPRSQPPAAQFRPPRGRRRQRRRPQPAVRRPAVAVRALERRAHRGHPLRRAGAARSPPPPPRS